MASKLRTFAGVSSLALLVVAVVSSLAARDDGPVKKEPVALSLMVQPISPPVRQGLAKYEPVSGCYLGAFINFDPTLKSPYKDIGGRTHQEFGPFEEKIGKPHASYFFYMGYGSRLPVDWLKKMADAGKFVHIALEPNNGLDMVKNDEYLRSLAKGIRRSGAKVFLRFASEMNGPWTKYHNDPAKYREKFRLVYRAMRDLAPNVAMVWCPFQTPIRLIDRYYPGDDAVDWVGVNVYSVTYHDNDKSDPAHNEDPIQLMGYVYKNYAKKKPVMIGEFAATHYSAVEKKQRPDFARDKILRLYKNLPKFPRVKFVNYFNSNNMQFAKHRLNNDYSVTNNATVLKAYQEAIGSNYFLGTIIWGDVEQESRPLSDGDELSGWVAVVAEPVSTISASQYAYKLDGRIIRLAPAGSGQLAEIDTRALPSGRHLFEAEAKDENGELVGYSRVEFAVK